MVEMIRDTLRKKRDYEAERRFLRDRFNDHRYQPTAKQKTCLAFPFATYSVVHHCIIRE